MPEDEGLRQSTSGITQAAHMLPLTADPEAAAARLQGAAYVSAEFIYQPRPTETRARAVFDFALRSRLAELQRTPGAAVLLIGRDEAAIASLAPLLEDVPALPVVAAITNPVPVDPAADPEARTPWQCAWEAPSDWRRYDLTDRWTRILFALEVARCLASPGYLVMPANDAVWGRGLLRRLTEFSQQHGQNGVPAAVSPYTPWQHSPVPGVAIPPQIIAALNAGFGRDSRLRQRITSGGGQAFWGKMSLLPFALADTVRRQVETMVWEDDLEIDRVLKDAGFAARCLWVEQRQLYRQSLPVFDRAGLRRVFERTLHYSLVIPAATPAGSSLLNQPLDGEQQRHRQTSKRYDAIVRLSEAVIADCNAAIAERLARCGLSWVDWGAYRYVVRVGDPRVQVWNCLSSLI